MTRMQTQPTPSRAHPFLADAAGWGLAEDHLTVIEAEGAAMVLLLGPLGAAAPLPGAPRGAMPETLAATFQLDAGDLPGIGERNLFAGELRLDFDGAMVTAATVQQLEWRSPTTLFAEVPFAIAEDGSPMRGGDAARVVGLVEAWARGPAAGPLLAAAARSGADAAVQAAITAKDAVIRNNRATQAQDIRPGARAHHLWWAARREEEVQRHTALAARLRRIQGDLAGPAGPG